jgi:lysylphosphatidylglycerol synthetase-like protein (DUF2156 family)
MTISSSNALFWAPRILTILFALFLTVFALDVFTDTKGVLQTLTALVMHLIPALLVVVLLVLAWRWELVGVIAFTALAIAYVWMSWGRFPLLTYVLISGPLLLISALFFLSWRREA